MENKLAQKGGQEISLKIVTLSQFKALSTREKDIFLESGEPFSEDVVSVAAPSDEAEVVCCDSTSLIAPETQQQVAIKEVPPSLPEEDSHTSSQPAVSLSSDQYSEGFDIDDPFELLCLVDDQIISGKDKLYKWQIQIMLDFAAGGQDAFHRFQAVVRACNGSGKDKYIVAACIVWACMKWPDTTGVVTSSSGFQLDRQTCRYIKHLAEAVNRKFQVDMWKLNYRNYKCDFGNGRLSEIFCYATDEAGKAEGFHPLVTGARLVIFASEDKTIPDEINVAINKYSGYTHRVHVSTPGLPLGHFYDYCTTAIKRKSIKSVTEVPPSEWIEYHVTHKDCPHIDPSYVEQMKKDTPGGEHGAAWQSQFMAEFGTTDEMVVIPYTYIWQSFNDKSRQWVQEEHNKAGVDLADGGAENSLFVRNGNKMLKQINFKFDNTEDTILFLEEKFRENSLTHPEAYIYGDSIGIGKPMLQALRRKGWSNIKFFDGRGKAYDSRVYKNRNSEIWFTIRKLFEEGQIILQNEPILVKQLSSRYYKLVEGTKHQLLSKLEQRSKGYPSPDRADACTYAFVDYKSTFVSQLESREKPYEEIEEIKQVGDFTLKGSVYGDTNVGYRRKYNVNSGVKDFGRLEDEISEYNKLVRER